MAELKALPVYQTGFPPYDSIIAENGDFALGVLIELPQAARPQDLIVWFDPTPTGNAKAALYAASSTDGTPAALLTSTGAQALVGGRNVFPLASVALAAGPLWIMIKMDGVNHLLGAAGGVVGFRGAFSNAFASAFPNPAPALDFDDVDCYSMSLRWLPDGVI
jgi:hypothetical protein